tara:strand:- start:2599 stop:3243 length:645 start_codon:yes stop_codon:yes gene_type:complete
MGTTDDGVKQIRALLEEEGNDLALRGAWQGMVQEASLTTVATESQGAITTIASGFRSIINQTIWSRTRRLPVCGPLDAKQWQMLKALFVNGPYYRHRIRGGLLLVNPVPPAGESWYFEYSSANWILGADGSTYKQYFTLDTDTLIIPESLALMGLRWRWKKEKGFDYSEDFRTYELQVKDALGRDGGKDTLCMDAYTEGMKPGVFVPAGTWMSP